MTTTRWPRLFVPLVVLVLLGPSLARPAHAQGEYRNLDAGFPVRVEDATVTERYALDLDFLNLRYDELSGLRTRLQYEPRLSYGILPNTEAWLRVAAYYREREITPRKGIAGIGLGGMYQWQLESLHYPAVAIASEAFFPTGPNALTTSYSFKTLLTKSVSSVRIHLNASLASYAIRLTPPACPVLPSGSVCGGQGNPPLPPFDGPCSIGSQSAAIPLSTFCAAPAPTANVNALAQAGSDSVVTHAHWMVGMAVDKALPLKSILVVADVFAERFEGIGRKTDLTAEAGLRRQVSPTVVFVGGVGRHFRGTNPSSFLIIGATYSRALQGFWRHL
jgi:hypothetical protein